MGKMALRCQGPQRGGPEWRGARAVCCELRVSSDGRSRATQAAAPLVLQVPGGAAAVVAVAVRAHIVVGGAEAAAVVASSEAVPSPLPLPTHFRIQSRSPHRWAVHQPQQRPPRPPRRLIPQIASRKQVAIRPARGCTALRCAPPTPSEAERAAAGRTTRSLAPCRRASGTQPGCHVRLSGDLWATGVEDG